MTSKEVISLIKNKELSDVLTDIVDDHYGDVHLEYDGREDGCISDINVFSHSFTKHHLDVLFRYTYEGAEVKYSKHRNQVRFHIEVSL